MAGAVSKEILRNGTANGKDSPCTAGTLISPWTRGKISAIRLTFQP